MTWRTVAIATIPAALAVLALNGVAEAATGHSFLLGRHNYANTTTTLTRTTRGVPLSITGRAGYAPLAVNSGTVVTHLNADLVDGKHATALETRATRFPIPRLAASSSSSRVVLNGVPHGIYQVSYTILAEMSSAGSNVNCYVTTDGTSGTQLISYGSAFATYSTSNASGVIDYRAGTAFALTCFPSAGTFNYYASPAAADSVTLIPIDGLSVLGGHTSPGAVSARIGSGVAGR